MGLVAQFSTSSQTELTEKMTENTKSKIPVYAKNHKKEWLYIRGINSMCGEFLKYLEANTNSLEKVIPSSRSDDLIKD